MLLPEPVAFGQKRQALVAVDGPFRLEELEQVSTELAPERHEYEQVAPPVHSLSMNYPLVVGDLNIQWLLQKRQDYPNYAFTVKTASYRDSTLFTLNIQGMGFICHLGRKTNPKPIIPNIQITFYFQFESC